MSKSVVDLVNILQGTDSHERFSRGNTLPLVARPFGMTHWAPMTNPNDKSLGPLSWFYHPRHHQIVGLRATHQPSPWMGDYATLCVMPVTTDAAPGRPVVAAEEEDLEDLAKSLLVTYQKRMSTFPPHLTSYSPDCFRTYLMRWRVGVELTATERCAVIRLTLPPHRRAWLLLDDPTSMAPGGSFASSFTFSHGGSDRLLTGYTTSNCGGVPEGFKGFFAVEADAPFVHTGFFTAEGVVELGRTKERTAQRLGAVVGFGASETERVVTIRVATSFIGAAQALANMRQETGTTKGYEEIQHESREVWEQWLGRVEVRGRAKRDRRTFYTSLYRALLFPRKFHELDAECKPFHYNPYSGGCHPGVLYTDNGFWDTHRTVYPFLALVYPTQCAEIMQGWVNAAKFGKRWFPKWASPGYRSMMVGTHSDVVVADTHLRGIPFDVELAYSLSRRNGLEPGDPQGAYGREGLEDYASLGFVPSDRFEHAVCRTNDYAYDDFGLAQLARVLGKEEDFALFGRRALNYRNMFDPNIGFMRGRNADGSWREPFSEFTWGGDYVEGSAWQHVFAVPHDPAGLVQLFGGEDKFCEKLDQMLALPPYFDIGTYWTEIHEMTEMAAARFGQYAHSNQPVHHVLYLFACGRQPWKTEYWVRRVMAELYGPEPDGLAGDEDNGEMSCWFLLSSLGLFPLCPGHPSFVFGSPFFEQATIHLESGGTLEIRSPGNGDPANVYVQRIVLNGADITSRSSLLHTEAAAGGVLEFTMGPEPNKARRFQDDKDLPFSFSREFRVKE